MFTIIQGNDTTVSVLLHSQSITLPDNDGKSYVERSKIDLSQAKDISVRLIPYMRWRPITPSFEVKGSTIIVHYPASVQRPGKWDVEITFLTPDSGGYRQNRVRQAFAEVIACAKGTNSPEAYVITADVAQAVQGAKGEMGKSAYEIAQEEEGFVGTKQEYLKSLHGEPGKDIYQLAVEDGYQGSRRDYLASQKGETGKSAYEMAKEEEGFVGTKQEYLKSLRGEPGKDIYQLAVEDGYQGSRKDYLASQKGETGYSAYQSYLKTTGDKIKLTEKQWSNSNDFFFQFLFRVLKGAGVQPTETDMTADQVYELDRQRREIIDAIKAKGVAISEADGLSKIAEIIRSDVAPTIKLYKYLQFYQCVNTVLPILEIWDGWREPTLAGMFRDSKELTSFPRIAGVERSVSMLNICLGNGKMVGNITLPTLDVCTSMEAAFRETAISSLTIGDAPECTSINNLVRNCSSIKSVKIGDARKCNDVNSAFASCIELREVTIGDLGSPSDCGWLFYKCSKLQRVNGVINLSKVVSNMDTIFDSCESLEEVRIKGGKTDINLSHCTSLSTESIKYLVGNLQQATGKSITLPLSWKNAHADEAIECAKAASQKGFTLNFR